MRKTNQKDAILSAVQKMQNHPSADQIYGELKKEIQKLSLGTVYRNLNKFSAQGEIQKVMIPGLSDRFDYRRDKHVHLLCKKCGSLFDADVRISIDATNSACRVEEYSLVLYGTCAACAAGEAAAKAQRGV